MCWRAARWPRHSSTSSSIPVMSWASLQFPSHRAEYVFEIEDTKIDQRRDMSLVNLGCWGSLGCFCGARRQSRQYLHHGLRFTWYRWRPRIRLSQRSKLSRFSDSPKTSPLVLARGFFFVTAPLVPDRAAIKAPIVVIRCCLATPSKLHDTY